MTSFSSIIGLWNRSRNVGKTKHFHTNFDPHFWMNFFLSASNFYFITNRISFAKNK